ncbi:hypothetical protein [Actinobacillus equuli]|uniref:hypothetical protein n=1 Tax=Actinobacillus equuli TaxID=718 RepID=UPI002441F3C1|nr:hypothetical protein [Actinobacillus equuli]WGE49192.1 hypothetical protein NYR67_02470 [Actinobacillus equuli subsp. equuli]
MERFKIETTLHAQNALKQQAKSKEEIDIEPQKTKKNHTTKAELEREKVIALQEQNFKSKDDRKMRREYANKAYEFAKYTIAFWMFLFLAYFLSPANNKPLNDTALGIFTTACTVNILAAFISIVKGLFPSSK